MRLNFFKTNIYLLTSLLIITTNVNQKRYFWYDLYEGLSRGSIRILLDLCRMHLLFMIIFILLTISYVAYLNKIFCSGLNMLDKSEAVTGGILEKKLFLKISQCSQEITFTGVSV